MRLGVMIEGQEHLTWERWRALGRLTEDLGFESLWRSDHFLSLTGEPDREALETWASLAVTAADTSRIVFGPLVCSVTFRHPSLLARMASAVDRLSGGRLVTGIGAGWHEGEHRAFGLPFPPVRQRMEMLEEQAQILRLLWTGEPVSFEGRHYRLENVRSLPAPVAERPPLLIGGSGPRRTLRIVAEHADEWNAVALTLEDYRDRARILDEHCRDVGRDPAEITRSWMVGFLVGRDEAELLDHAARVRAVLRPLAGMELADMVRMFTERGWLVGTPEQIVEQIREREAAGVQRMMLQHHAHEDDDALRLIAAEVLPAATD